ncbi:hypothetical protein MCERE19_01155 [Spirosomataceae bacterium]
MLPNSFTVVSMFLAKVFGLVILALGYLST